MSIDEVSQEYVMSKFANERDLRAAMVAEIAALRTQIAAIQPPQDERGQGLGMDAMQAIYAKAWMRAADWANRHDLHSDVGSPEYLKDMAIELAEFADAAIAQPVAAEVEKDAQRYRFLRMDAGIRNERPFIAISSTGGISQWIGFHADKKIDSAMAGTGSDESAKETK